MDHLDAKTRELIRSLSIDSAVAEQALREWFQIFPESLWRVVGSMVLKELSASKVPPFVLRLLAAENGRSAYLCNPDLLAEPAAKELAKLLIMVDPRLDIRLARAAIEWAATETDRKIVGRCMAILETLYAGSRINSALVQLLNCGNAAVRSKVVELLVRWSTNEGNVREWMRDADPRVRANVIESLADIGQGMKWIRQVLLDHLNDRHGRTAANAAIGLYRLGIVDPALARLSEMAAGSDATIRCSAAWAIGQIPDPRQLDTLGKLRTDTDPRVRWLALKSLSGFNRAGIRPKPLPCPAEQPAEHLIVEAAEAPPPPPQLHEEAEREPEMPVFVTRTFGRLL